jgi:hypothetical protein
MSSQLLQQQHASSNRIRRSQELNGSHDGSCPNGDFRNTNAVAIHGWLVADEKSNCLVKATRCSSLLWMEYVAAQRSAPI